MKLLYEMISGVDANLMILAVVFIVIIICVTAIVVVYIVEHEKTKRHGMSQDSLSKLITDISTNKTSSLTSEVSTGNDEREDYRRSLEKAGIGTIIRSGLNMEKKESVFVSCIRAIVDALTRKKKD